jgi:hypothetical protein
VLHLGGVGKYVSLIWGWSIHSRESGDLHQPPPLSDNLTNSVHTFVPLDNIAPTPVQSSVEEVPCVSFLAEMTCASAHSSEVHSILYPPTKPTYEHPGSWVVTTVGDDPEYLAQVDNQVVDQESFVNAVLIWNTSILSKLHITEALDEALFKWDYICMGSFNPKWSPILFRDYVLPGNGVVCGVWAQVASSPSASFSPNALVPEPVLNDIGPSESITFLVTGSHAWTYWISLPALTFMHSALELLSHYINCWIQDATQLWLLDFHIVGLSDGDALALVCCLAMTANLLANTGTSICLGNNVSLFIDLHDIDPIPIGVATTLKNAMQITYCRWMGYLPMPCEDGSIHMQPWYIHTDALGCKLSPESIMLTSLDITSWYSEGFRGNLSPGILCFRNSDK